MRKAEAVRIGVFGGTFDPIHHGHLIAGAEAYARLALDRLLYVPAALPPHKRGRTISDPELRLAMVRAAVAGDDRFEVDDLEMRRAGPSFTVDTLRELRARWPDAELVLLIGGDSIGELDTWKDIQGIARLARLVAVEREGEASGTAPVEYESIRISRIDISATQLRKRAREGRSLRYYVPEAVRKIVEREGLYGAPGADEK